MARILKCNRGDYQTGDIDSPYGIGEALVAKAIQWHEEAHKGLMPKLSIRKYGGDDPYSWAVFRSDSPTPIVSGCSRAEAQSHKKEIQRMYEERGQ